MKKFIIIIFNIRDNIGINQHNDNFFTIYIFPIFFQTSLNLTSVLDNVIYCSNYFFAYMLSFTHVIMYFFLFWYHIRIMYYLLYLMFHLLSFLNLTSVYIEPYLFFVFKKWEKKILMVLKRAEINYFVSCFIQWI